MCVFTEEPGRGCTHGHVGPHHARSRVDVYQFRRQRLARLIHSSFSFPLTGRALCLLCSIYSGGICLCHTDVNVYTWWTLGWVFTVWKRCVRFWMCGDSFAYLLSSLGMWDPSQALAIGFLKPGARFTCLIVVCLSCQAPAASLLGSRLQVPADVEKRNVVVVFIKHVNDFLKNIFNCNQIFQKCTFSELKYNKIKWKVKSNFKNH